MVPTYRIWVTVYNPIYKNIYVTPTAVFRGIGGGHLEELLCCYRVLFLPRVSRTQYYCIQILYIHYDEYTRGRATAFELVMNLTEKLVLHSTGRGARKKIHNIKSLLCLCACLLSPPHVYSRLRASSSRCCLLYF